MWCRAWPKVRLTWSAVPRSVNSWRLWEGTERDKYKWCLMLSLETSWADLVLFCRNIASLFLKPQKRLASAAPSVKAFLLPLFCCSEFDSCYLSWCPLVQVLQEVRTMGIYPPSLHTVTFLQTFFLSPAVTSFTLCSVLTHWSVPCTADFSAFDLLCCLSLNIFHLCYKPFEEFSCSVT